jgi:hypothetical protein
MTANAGEHALSMKLAESLNYASGYSVEPYEFINMLEKFGGLLPSPSSSSPPQPSPLTQRPSDDDNDSSQKLLSSSNTPSINSPSSTTSLETQEQEQEQEQELNTVIQKGVEIFQIESRNPHFHEEKGADHIADMMEDSLLAINNSKICSSELIKEIRNHLQLLLQVKQKNSNDNTQNSNSVINVHSSSNGSGGNIGRSNGKNHAISSLIVNHSSNSSSSSPCLNHFQQQQLPQEKKKYLVMDPILSIPIDRFAAMAFESSSTFNIY